MLAMEYQPQQLDDENHFHHMPMLCIDDLSLDLVFVCGLKQIKPKINVKLIPIIIIFKSLSFIHTDDARELISHIQWKTISWWQR